MGSEPPSFVYPYPLVPLAAFMVSGGNFIKFVISLIFVFFYCSATNLWNHINDAEVDIKFGKKDFEILIMYKKFTLFFVIIFYILGGLLVYLFTYDKSTSVLLYFISTIVTWAYSDKILFGRKIKRLKEHFVTEILTYLIVLPLSSLVLWSFFACISVLGFVFSALISILYLSLVLLKDLKDISSDTYAGYQTLAVTFSPLLLIKLSYFMNFVFYLIIVVSIYLNILSWCYILVFCGFILYLYSLLGLKKAKWNINSGVMFVKYYIFSSILSLILLSVSGFCSNYIVKI